MMIMTTMDGINAFFASTWSVCLHIYKYRDRVWDRWIFPLLVLNSCIFLLLLFYVWLFFPVALLSCIFSNVCVSLYCSNLFRCVFHCFIIRFSCCSLTHYDWKKGLVVFTRSRYLEWIQHIYLYTHTHLCT